MMTRIAAFVILAAGGADSPAGKYGWRDGPQGHVRGRDIRTGRGRLVLTRLRVTLRRPIWLALISITALTATTKAATALTWNWSYSGTGIEARGTFTTVDAPDGSGFYLITAIAGERNGAAILGLQPTGTPIPGNEPFAVDNVVRLESPQLTVHGVGYAIAGGTFSNPFFADFLATTGVSRILLCAALCPRRNRVGRYRASHSCFRHAGSRPSNGNLALAVGWAGDACRTRLQTPPA